MLLKLLPQPSSGMKEHTHREPVRTDRVKGVRFDVEIVVLGQRTHTSPAPPSGDLSCWYAVPVLLTTFSKPPPLRPQALPEGGGAPVVVTAPGTTAASAARMGAAGPASAGLTCAHRGCPGLPLASALPPTGLA